MQKIIPSEERGFTLIELVMVIVILGILGAVAAPQFVNLATEARTANENAVASAVRSGITTYFVDPARGNRASFPSTLDSATNAACSTTNACFDTVLPGGIRDQWTRLSAATYRSPVNGTNVWTYSSTNGSFAKTTA